MSLINQMLQDLDARGSDGARAGNVHADVRAVQEQRGNRLGWWVALALAVLLGGMATWIWLRATGEDERARNARATESLPLKFASDLNRAPKSAAVEQTAPPAPQPEARPDPVPPIAATPVEVAAPAMVPPATSAMPATGRDTKTANLPAAAAPQARSAQTAAMAPVTAASVATAPAERKADRIEPPKPADQSAQGGTPPAATKQVRELTAVQRAENEYRRGTSALAQDRTAEAIGAFDQALALDPRHTAARQTLVGLLLDGGRQDEAVRKLQEGLAVDTSQTGLAMILARLQVEKGDTRSAIDSLQRSLPHAAERADYRAFLAALLQRQGRHDEAIGHYGAALRVAPQNGVWWMGLGISMQAANRLPEARNAFSRAKASNSLSPELQAFVEQKLSQLPN